jgi:hypothetical protein
MLIAGNASGNSIETTHCDANERENGRNNGRGGYFVIDITNLFAYKKCTPTGANV